MNQTGRGNPSTFVVSTDRAMSCAAGQTEPCGRLPCEQCPSAKAACCRAVSKVGQAVLLSVGVLAVALGAIGVVVPGLPTTVFLIIAAWCFCRSCPPLERWLLSTRMFRPYAAFLGGSTPMPPRAVRFAIVSIWAASMISSAIILTTGDGARPWWIVAAIATAAVGGTACVVIVARRSRRVLA